MNKKAVDISLLPFIHNRHLTKDIKDLYIHSLLKKGLCVSFDKHLMHKNTHMSNGIQYINIMDTKGKEWCSQHNIDISNESQIVYSFGLPN